MMQDAARGLHAVTSADSRSNAEDSVDTRLSDHHSSPSDDTAEACCTDASQTTQQLIGSSDSLFTAL